MNWDAAFTALLVIGAVVGVIVLCIALAELCIWLEDRGWLGRGLLVMGAVVLISVPLLVGAFA